MPTAQPNFYIRDSDLLDFISTDHWIRFDLTPEEARRLASFLDAETTSVLGVLVSGSLASPRDEQMIHGIKVYAGLDLLRYENKPRPGEPPINAYHYVVGAPITVGNATLHPVFGPHTAGAVLEHHATEAQLTSFFAGSMK